MANTKSAAKRARQTTTRTTRNSGILTGLKTEQKKFRKTLTSGDEAAVKAGSITLASALDKAAKRGAIHRNVANRRKSKLARALKPKTA